MSPRRLIVMRHSKAVRDAATDHDRPLSNRGLRDAGDAGQQLAALGMVPDLGLVSSAARTRETWAAVTAQFAREIEVSFDRSLYGGGTDQLLEAIHCAPQDVETVMLVGHNPTVEMLVSDLDDGGAEGDRARIVLGGGFVTSALAVFDVQGGWEAVGPGACVLVDAYVGRG